MKNLSLLLLIVVTLSTTFPLYNQCDNKWGNQRIGGTSNTICQNGDDLTALAMALTGLGKTYTPSTLNTWLKANKGYDRNGNLVWNSLTPLGMNYQGMVPNVLIKLNLDVGYIVIMEVKRGPHYVLATGYSGDTISVNDPLYISTKTYDLNTVISGKTAIYKVPVSQSYKFNSVTQTLKSIARKRQSSLVQE